MNTPFSKVSQTLLSGKDNGSLYLRARRLFTEHPHATDETYGEHALFTLKTGLLLCYCGVVILVHGIFPFLFTRTASRHLERLNHKMKQRAVRSQQAQADTIEWYL